MTTKNVNVNQNGDYYVFDINRDGGSDAIRFTHQTCVCYNTKTGVWTGDEINAEGWVNLDEGQVDTLIKYYDLESYIQE